MSSGGGRRGRVLSAEERILWTTVIKSVAPLRGGNEADDDGGIVGGAVRPKPSAAKPAPIPPLPGEGKHLALHPLGRRMKQRVARGREAIDGRLDLHGLTQSEAHAALLRFLRAASARGARLVLVITGKGAREGGSERGVLKRQVPHWLGLPEFRTLVVGFDDAHVTHGGEGALYVRVRRRKPS
jgi:DNA-nicking Smr family endonuclease